MTQLCSVCPRGCGVDRAGGQLGFCAVPDAPMVARAAPHFGEEPCISGTRGSGAVFFSGCSLRCVFCQNRDISRGEHGKEITVAQLLQVMANVALRAETDKIILGGMGMTNDDYLYFKNVFSNAGALDRIISFVNTTENPPVERLLIPDMALTAAEYFAVEHNQKVLVLLTDMTSYADALAIVSNRMDQIPSKDSMPGSLYSDLAKIYEKAVQFPSGGSITIIAVTTLSGGDITHAVPDNTGYITEGQLFLRRDSDIGKVIVDPFRSLSRLKQLVSGKKTRKDHPQVMNAAVRLYADAANAKTKMENGFDLTNYDERALAFAKDYANQLLAIDVNLNTTEMLDVTWGLFSKYFKPEEVNIKKEFVDQYWKK